MCFKRLVNKPCITTLRPSLSWWHQRRRIFAVWPLQWTTSCCRRSSQSVSGLRTSSGSSRSCLKSKASVRGEEKRPFKFYIKHLRACPFSKGVFCYCTGFFWTWSTGWRKTFCVSMCATSSWITARPCGGFIYLMWPTRRTRSRRTSVCCELLLCLCVPYQLFETLTYI